MTTIRRRYVNDDWCYQILPNNRPEDRDTLPFVPWTKLPPEVMCLISLCLMGLQKDLEPVAPDEWKIPSRALETWETSSQQAAHENAYMEHDFRYNETEASPATVPPSADHEIRIDMTSDPDRASKDWISKGFKIIGWVDAVCRGDGEPPERPAIARAKQVGATAVLYNLWPAKLRAIKRLPDKSIDLASLLADPPKKLRPNGFYVVKAIFLREV
ncbi:hypothetical protein [uncultured Massilia sp.]|uniref:hypothetical protein n=1 Tax=uncultured Massilia sp. TaxID=169973 RepID=UPI0025FB4205|nr:hypothetical protein [uncultured Massilia sp.]